MHRSRRAFLRASATIAVAGSGCLGIWSTPREGQERIEWAVETRSLVGEFVVTREMVFALTPHHLLAMTHDGEQEWSKQIDEFDDTLNYDKGIAADERQVYLSGTPETAAYDHDGERQWVTEDVRTFRRMTVDADQLYLEQRGLVALDRETGDERWRSLADDAGTPTPPAVVDGTVYAGLGDGRFTALAADDGRVLWTEDTGVERAAVPVERDGVVYVGGDNPGTDTGALLALNPDDKRELWRVATGQVLSDSRPTVTDDIVYVGTGSGRVHAHDRSTGTERWSFEADNDDGLSRLTPPAVGPAVYTKASDGFVYAIDLDEGEERWRVEVGGGSVKPKYVNGTLYAGSYDGLFAIEPERP